MLTLRTDIAESRRIASGGCGCGPRVGIVTVRQMITA